MNKNKVILITIILLLSFCTMCGGAESESGNSSNEKIRIVYEQWIRGDIINIVNIDNHLYLINVKHGGIIHLESCPCKKQNKKENSKHSSRIILK